jgi:hypothetical protein
MSNPSPARRAHAAETNEQTEKAALEVAPTFALSTRIDPASAVIWLDRHPVATGHLDIVLPRDGSTHELRVAAPGFIPVTLLFADVPPPEKIQLESMPSASGDPLLEPALAPVAIAPTARAPSLDSKSAIVPRGANTDGARKRPGAGHAVGAGKAPAAPAGIVELTPREGPRVQVVGEDAPQVRVIE